MSSLISINVSDIEAIYYHLNSTCDKLNEQFDTNEIHLPCYDFDSFYEDVVDTHESGDTEVKMVLSTGKHRIAAYFSFDKASNAHIRFSSLNATRSEVIKKFNTTIKNTGNSNYTIDLLCGDVEHKQSRRASYVPHPNQEASLDDVVDNFNVPTVTGTKQEIVARIASHKYFSKTHKNIANVYDFFKFIVTYYNVRGNEKTIMIPMYSAYTDIANGFQLSHNSEIYNILHLVNNIINPEKVSKSTLDNHFNGPCIGPISNSDTLIISEGFMNTAITHYTYHNNGVKASGLVLNGVTGYNKFYTAMANIGPEKSNYKKIIIVPDNDAGSGSNEGMKVATLTAKKLLKLGFSVSMLDSYIGATSATSSGTKCDIYDAYQEMGKEAFTALLLRSLDFVNTPTEFAIQQKTRGFTKKHKNAIETLLDSLSGKYINWTTHSTVVEAAKSPLFGSVPALHRAICQYLGESYSNMQHILNNEETLLSTVEYVDGRPTIDTKKAMFFGDSTKPVLVKAPMGSGKTENVLRPFLAQTDKFATIVLPNVALTKQISTHFKDMNVTHYKSIDGDVKGRVVTTIDSLSRFNSSGEARPIIVDEIQQVIGLFCSEDRLPNKLALLEQLKQTIEGGKQFVGTSADIDDATLIFFKKVFKTSAKVAVFGTRVADNPNKEVPATYYNRVQDFRVDCMADMDNREKILYVTDSLKEAERAKAECDLYNLSCKVISSKTKDHTIYEPNEIDKKYDVIVVTPSASVGVSFTVNTRKVYAYYTGTIDTTSFTQLISRTRKRASVSVYERLIHTNEKTNKLRKQSANTDYTANYTRLSGLALDLLSARSEFNAVTSLSMIESLINQGYEPEFIEPINNEYTDQIKQHKLKIEAQVNSNKVAELERYTTITRDLSATQINEILTETGKERANDETKTACVLHKYDSLELDGITALNKKWFNRINIASLELDTDLILTRTLTEQQNAKSSVICVTDYAQITRIIHELKRKYDAGQSLVTDYINILDTHFENKEAFMVLQSQVLNPLGIKVPFLHGALQYKDFITKAKVRIVTLLLKTFGYNVVKKEVFKDFENIRDKSLNVAYNELINNLDVEAVYVAMLEDIEELESTEELYLDEVTF